MRCNCSGRHVGKSTVFFDAAIGPLRVLLPHGFLFPSSEDCDCILLLVQPRTDKFMSTTVTLHIYSGLPDPAWELSNEQISELKSLISSFRTRTLLKPPGLLGRLGYRGFTIESVAEPGLEASMYAHAGVLDVGRLDLSILMGEPALEAFLLSTARDVLAPDLADYVKQQLSAPSLADFQNLTLDERLTIQPSGTMILTFVSGTTVTITPTTKSRIPLRNQDEVVDRSGPIRPVAAEPGRPRSEMA